MTTRTELLDILRNGESSGVEFKRDDIENFKLARELVAFSNLQGGMVILGVEDDGSISGLVRPGLEEWVMTTCRDKIRPEIIPYFEAVRDVEPGKDVAIVRVERGYAVHHLWHSNHRTYYIRVGTQCREASSEELERLFQQRGNLRVETRPVSGTSLADLDRRRMHDYFSRILSHEVPEDDDEAWRTLLSNTELMEGEAVTVAGLVLFGTNVGRYLPQAAISATAYPGVEKDYAARERVVIRGPMTPLVAGGVVQENGVVEQAVEFVRRNTGVTAALEEGARRTERPAYPEAALREAIVNALIHRDYGLSSTDVELSVYEDRIEIVSPGRLPNGITPERMRTGCRAARNQILKDVMRDYGYLEASGLGVPRKIIRGMRQHNNTEPDLVEDGETFTVRLWKAPAP